MKKKKHNIPFNKTQRISHILMLNSLSLKDLGLYEGKMGIAITFAHLFRYTNNDVYYDCMSNLLDDILENINKDLGYDFKSGLSGIGWSIEYLIQNNFVEGSSVEICEEIDKRIMDVDPRRISDFSIENGFEGLLHYVIYHLQGAIKQKTKLPFDNLYLSDIYDTCRILKNKSKSKSLSILLDIYTSFIEDKIMKDYDVKVIYFASNIPELQLDKLTTYPHGLNSGLAGALLDLITKEDNKR